MAAYAATVALDQRSAAKFGNGGFKLLSGKVTISNYNQTLAEITGLTGEFRNLANVVLEGVTTTGHLVVWDRATKSIKSFVPTTQAQTANDVNIGAVNFLAFGV